MDVSVITLSKDFDLSKLKEMFPRSVVTTQNAVDLRQVDPRNMYAAGIIGESAYTTLTSGRKWHWEFNGRGGVGLAHSNRLALSKGSNNMLLFEEDFDVISVSRFKEEVDRLNLHASEFDMAVFGAQYHGEHKDLIAVDFMPAGWYYIRNDKFWFLHCAFYSSRGRKKVANLLCNRRLEMQIDSLYSMWAEMNKLTIIIQLAPWTVVQKGMKLSTIQNDICVLCDVSPNLWPNSPNLWPNSPRLRPIQNSLVAVCSLLLVVVLLAVLYCIRRRKTRP